MNWKFVLPKGAARDAAEKLREEVASLEAVDRAKVVRPRSVGSDMMLWVSVAANVVGIATAGYALFEKVRGAIRKQKLEGVHIERPDGVRISLDKASPQEIQALLSELDGPAKRG
jgi:hypothetical protein